MSEEQVCKEIIEQVGYQEFYRYFQEKTTLIEQQRKEIERLNNIINEIERFVKNCIEYNSKCNSTIYEARAFEDSVILHKIKELKGSEKE